MTKDSLKAVRAIEQSLEAGVRILSSSQKGGKKGGKSLSLQKEKLERQIKEAGEAGADAGTIEALLARLADVQQKQSAGGKKGGKSLSLQKEKLEWQIKEAGEAGADAGTIEALLARLADVQQKQSAGGKKGGVLCQVCGANALSHRGKCTKPSAREQGYGQLLLTLLETKTAHLAVELGDD